MDKSKGGKQPEKQTNLGTTGGSQIGVLKNQTKQAEEEFGFGGDVSSICIAPFQDKQIGELNDFLEESVL